VETANVFHRAQELDALARRRPNPEARIAIALYDDAIRLNPTNALYYLDRAAARRHARDMAGAIADLNKAIELSPRGQMALETARKWKADWTGATGDEQYEDVRGNGK
jgi:tetratricopeptide (TPR) repeat protein